MDEQQMGSTPYEPKLQPAFAPAYDLAGSQSSLVQEALGEIHQQMGLVPEPFRYLTEEGLPGIWEEAKALQFAAETALPPRYRYLINLGVAAQIPCRYSIYLSLKWGESVGATTQEQTEAVVMAGITRHWSTILNGVQIPMDEFRREVEQIQTYVKEQMGSAPPPRDFFLTKFTEPAETYQDIEKTLGMVPKFFLAFPERGLPGAWSEMKAVELNPYTAIPAKYKELIGLSVAAQIPCSYCVLFHRTVASLHGATSDEIDETLSLAALTRHWSTVVNGLRLGEEQLHSEIDRVLHFQHGEVGHH